MSATRLDTVRKVVSTLGVALLVAAFCYNVAGYLGARRPGFVLTAVKGFSITSTLDASTCTTAAKLAPGVPRCLVVSIGNPLSVPIEVTALSMAVTSFTPTASNHHTPACTATMLTVPSTLTVSTLVVPARSEKTVHTTIELKTIGTQNNCENGTFGLAFSGSAVYTESTTTTLIATRTGHSADLSATVTPANPGSDPYGPGSTTAPVHHVDFYACTTTSCATKSLLTAVTLSTTTPTSKVATAATTVSGLSTGTHYFKVVYPATGTHSGTFTGSTSPVESVTIPGPSSSSSSADFTLSRSDVPTTHKPVVPGAPIAYAVTVSNNGRARGTATVTVPVPSTETLSGTPTCTTVGVGDTCAATVTGSTLVITVDLAAAHSAKVGFDATVAPGDTSTVENTATITSGTCTTTCAATVTNPVVVLSVVKSSTPTAGSIVALGQRVVYTLTMSDAGTAATTPITMTDTVPAGTSYVPGSASCRGAPGCRVTETAGTVTWKTLVVGHGAANAISPSFEVTVNSSDTTGETITNVATFTNDGTPTCTTPTCPTNPVTLTVTAKSSAASGSPPPPPHVSSSSGSSTPPTLSPVPGATTAHTGEPFAGSGRIDLVAGIIGLGLLAIGESLRRRQKKMATRGPTG